MMKKYSTKGEADSPVKPSAAERPKTAAAVAKKPSQSTKAPGSREDLLMQQYCM